MMIIIFIVAGAFIFWIIYDLISKDVELNNDSTFSQGLIKKYPNLFDYLENDNFDIVSNKRDEVKLSRIISTVKFSVSIELTIMYVANHKLHFIVQIYLVSPNRHIKTTSFIYPSTASENLLIRKIQDDVGLFIQRTLEGS